MLYTFGYYYPLIITCLSCALIGLTSGLLGAFAFLKRQSLLGDAISHASLPGIVLALIITQQKNPFILLTGGAIAGSIGTLLTILIQRYTKLHKDTILGIILSVFFGFGLLLLSHLQKYPNAEQALINKFLFGNATILLISDLYVIIFVACVITFFIFTLYKELVTSTFDPLYMHMLGNAKTITDICYITLLVLTIVVGLQTIGVILMSSLLIAPAAAAQQWSSQFKHMLIISGCIGMGSTVVGGVLSNSAQVPSGPIIVILLSIIVFCSLLIAPNRGILWPLLQKERSI